MSIISSSPVRRYIAPLVFVALMLFYFLPIYPGTIISGKKTNDLVAIDSACVNPGAASTVTNDYDKAGFPVVYKYKTSRVIQNTCDGVVTQAGTGEDTQTFSIVAVILNIAVASALTAIIAVILKKTAPSTQPVA